MRFRIAILMLAVFLGADAAATINCPQSPLPNCTDPAYCRCSTDSSLSSTIGDPVDMMYGGTILRRSDATFQTPLGPVSFIRAFSNKMGSWNPGGSYPFDLTGVPKPFGGGSTQDSVLWWHTMYSFVAADTNYWNVLDANGHQNTYFKSNCASMGAASSCEPEPVNEDRSAKGRLKVFSKSTSTEVDHFVFYAADGMQYRYGDAEKYTSPQTHRVFYFLESITNSDGQILATPSYSNALPSGCPRGLFPDGGTPPPGGPYGFSPYLTSVGFVGGGTNTLSYKLLPTLNVGGDECVPSTFSVLDQGSGNQQLVETFHYTVLTYTDGGPMALPDGGIFETGGLLNWVELADAGIGQYTVGEKYAYSPGPRVISSFSTSMDGLVTAVHNYEPDSGVSISITEVNASSLGASNLYTVSIDQTTAPDVDRLRTCNPIVPLFSARTGTYGTASHLAQAGDDMSSPITVTESVLSMSLAGNGSDWALHNNVPNQRSVSCGGSAACSAGDEYSGWSCTVSPGFNPVTPEEQWVGNRANEWEFKSYDAGPHFHQPELVKLQRGGSSQGTSSFLEATNYTYWYDGSGVGNQHIATESEVSANTSSSLMKTTYYTYSPTGRINSVIHKGYTSAVAAGVISFPASTPTYIGTFYFSTTKCGGAVTDPYDRVLEVHGPCQVISESSTDCDFGTAPISIPVTKYAYWAVTLGNAKAQLYSVSRYPNATVTGTSYSCPSPTLVTTYNTYDPFGNPTSVTDPNSVTTTYTYSNGKMTSKTVAGAQTNYFYENDKLAAIQYPTTPESGNKTDYEVYCYRDNATSCTTSANWTGSLMWKARSPNRDGSSPWEKVTYTYWPDGTLRDERYSDATQERRRLTHAADAEGRPAFTRWGASTGSYTAPRLFDGANNEIGVGLPFNGAPTLCNSSGAFDPKCAALSYDALNRLSKEVYPSPFNSSASCFTWDSTNTQLSVGQGCTASACGTCATTSIYKYDDFGNIISVQLPWTDNGSGAAGTTMYAYDARGNKTDKAEPTTVLPDGGSTPTLHYSYDVLGRLQQESTACATGSGCIGTMQYKNTYDVPDTTTCHSAAVAKSYGRLYSRLDSFGTTYYEYDSLGNVIAELRDRAGTGCSTTPTNWNQNPNTTYAYDTHSNLLSMGYPYGRTVSYVYDGGAGPDHPSSIYVVQNGVTTKLIDKVAWEPYGGLRGYEIEHTSGRLQSGVEYALGDVSTDALPFNCTISMPSMSSSDLTGRVRALVVRGGAFSAGGLGTTNIYNRFYKYSADQIIEEQACVGSDTSSSNSTYYGYDSLLHLTTPYNLGQSLPFGYRTYSVDTAGQRSSETDELLHATTYNYDYSSNSHGWLNKVMPLPDSGWKYTYTNFNDGAVRTKSTAVDSSGGPGMVYNFNEGPSDIDGGAASETVFRAVGLNGAYYNYFYDANGHRRYKSYPSGIGDEYFYDQSGNLIVDQGNSAYSSPTYFTLDNYVWLGGRPVIIFRGITNTSWVAQADTSTTCGRMGEANPCGPYFPVTDQVNKPLLMLDAAQRITGLGEYEPFGQVNRVALDLETPHPYPSQSGGTVATLISTSGGSTVFDASTVGGLKVDYRAKFQSVDVRNYTTARSYCATAPITDGFNLVDDTSGVGITTSFVGNHAGTLWTPWGTPASGKAHAALTYGNYSYHSPFMFSPCTSGISPPATFFGAVVEGYEYRRYDGAHGASPFWTPLRFAGQYHDEETDLNENHHRYYEPLTGRYLGPEPLELKPGFAREMAEKSMTSPTYSYANHNPINSSDPSGLFIKIGLCPNWDDALARARQRAGCSSNSVCQDNKKTWCQKEIDVCSHGCDICRILSNGAAPAALIVGEPARGVPTLNPPSIVYAGGITVHYGIRQAIVGIRQNLCFDLDNVETLADVLLEEGIHSCDTAGGFDRVKDKKDLDSPEDVEPCSVQYIKAMCP